MIVCLLRSEEKELASSKTTVHPINIWAAQAVDREFDIGFFIWFLGRSPVGPKSAILDFLSGFGGSGGCSLNSQPLWHSFWPSFSPRSAIWVLFRPFFMIFIDPASLRDLPKPALTVPASMESPIRSLSHTQAHSSFANLHFAYVKWLAFLKTVISCK